jgi:prepilin-type processing-associated H-X9-DG protein
MWRISLLVVLGLVLAAWTHGGGAANFLFGAAGGNCNGNTNQCLLDNSSGKLLAQ